jgi:hypothetical protein
MCKRGLSKPRRAVEEDMVKRLSTVSCCLNINTEVIL